MHGRAAPVRRARGAGFRLAALAVAAALVAGCGGDSGGSGGSKLSSGAPGTTGNTVPIVVDAGPPGVNAVNVPYVTITVCAPGSSADCETIDHVIVDTGSTGLRLLAPALSSSLTLTRQTDAGGAPIAECVQFIGSWSWGSLATADVTVGGVTAAAQSVQIIADPGLAAAVPTSCSNAGQGLNSVVTFGGNGILGVGPYLQDCGPACGSAALAGFYYSCPAAGGCQPIARPLALQVSNTVAAFGGDDNGVIVELPAIAPAGALSAVNGTLVFGIGTRSNNGLGAAKIFAIDPATGGFTTTLNGSTLAGSFIDSGSNGLFFPDSSLAACTSSAGFYCPPSPVGLSAINSSGTVSSQVSFTIIDLDTAPAAAVAFSDVGGTDLGSGTFDWGLPFFFGRSVYTAFESYSTPAATGPFWAY
jgi:hypothetical protein